MEKVFTTLGFVKEGFQIYDRNNMNIFLNAHKGKKVQMELKVFNEVSGNVMAYFYAVVIPRAREGFNMLGNRFTNRDTEEELKMQSPETLIENFNTEKCKWEFETKGISKLSSLEMSRFIEDIFRFCATELDVVLPNPNDFSEK